MASTNWWPCSKNGDWLPAIKISESSPKTLNPGNKQVWRLYDERQRATADFLCLDDEAPASQKVLTLYHPTDHSKQRQFAVGHRARMEPLLVDILREGKGSMKLSLSKRCGSGARRMRPALIPGSGG